MNIHSPRYQSRILSFFHHFLLFASILCILTSCESRKVIVNSLEEKEANEILVYLSNKGVDATKIKAESEGGGGGNKGTLWNISVESSQANEAMALLNQAGLPRRRSQNLLNLFSNSSLVPSGMQEKIRFQAGTAEQIASTIRKIDGVLDADVQISYPEEDPLNPNAPKQKVTASVYVKHSGVLDDPNAHLTTRIKRLVAAAVNGLEFDNVTVIGDRARYSEGSLGGLPGSLNEEERPFVNVWSITVAKDSLTRFQIFFFSFIIIILLLIFLLGFLIWKFFPLLAEIGGVKKLLSLSPLHLNDILSAIENKNTEAQNETPIEEKNDETPPSSS